MAYEILNTCMLIPGISEGDCAGWVQAWGSMIGLGIAIGVPWWQRAEERRHQKRTEIAIATVVGSSIALNFSQIIGCLNGIIREMNDLRAGDELTQTPRKFIHLLKTLALPTENQLLQIAAMLPTSAIQLARASKLIEQAIKALELIEHDYFFPPNISKTKMLGISPWLEYAKRDFEVNLPVFEKLSETEAT